VLGHVVPLEPAEEAAGLGGRERLVERRGGVRRKIVEDDLDARGPRIVKIDEIDIPATGY
jgi:hypothetical protein